MFGMVYGKVLITFDPGSEDDRKMVMKIIKDHAKGDDHGNLVLVDPYRV